MRGGGGHSGLGQRLKGTLNTQTCPLDFPAAIMEIPCNLAVILSTSSLSPTPFEPSLSLVNYSSQIFIDYPLFSIAPSSKPPSFLTRTAAAASYHILSLFLPALNPFSPQQPKNLLEMSIRSSSRPPGLIKTHYT